MVDKPKNLIGSQVRRIRSEAGLSQDALAAKLQLAGWDISRSGLSKIEASLRRVNDAELWMLGKCLARPIADLFPGEPIDPACLLNRKGDGTPRDAG